MYRNRLILDFNLRVGLDVVEVRMQYQVSDSAFSSVIKLCGISNSSLLMKFSESCILVEVINGLFFKQLKVFNICNSLKLKK